MLSYLKLMYSPNEPIFSEDIYAENVSEVNKRRQLMLLTNSGELRRFENGVYYFPKINEQGEDVPLSVDEVMRAKFIERQNRIFGFYSGNSFAYEIGLIEKAPAVTEIVSNEIGTAVKKFSADGKTFIVRKSKAYVNKENVAVLQLLDLLKDLDEIVKSPNEQTKSMLHKFITEKKITKKAVDEFIKRYPLKVYKTIYEMELAEKFLTEENG